MSKYLDSNGLLYVWGKIKALLSGKVNVEAGKGLSANDYTTAEKTKLAGLANYTHPTASGSKHVPAGGASGQILRWAEDGTATWGADTNTTYSAMTGATSGAAGVSGLVPAPAAGAQGKYLRGDGLWETPPDTNTTYAVATSGANGLMAAADKAKLDGFGAASTYALKTDIAGVYKYKGSKTSFATLPGTGNVAGDVWNVEADGMNYAWTGTAWDSLGSALSLEAITNGEIDTILAS